MRSSFQSTRFAAGCRTRPCHPCRPGAEADSRPSDSGAAGCRFDVARPGAGNSEDFPHLGRVFGLVLLTLCLLALASGCAAFRAEEPDELEEALVRPPPPTDGSIYQEGFGDPYGDRRARRVGDIVTVNIIEEASATTQTKTETGRDSTLDASISDLFGLPQNLGVTNVLATGQPFSPSVKGDYARQFKGSGNTERKGKLIATVTARVVEVFPGGNLRIKGHRHVKVNREKQLILVEGLIRTEDISPANAIASTQIADADISYRGRGVLSDVGGPGWLARALDWLWPI